MITMSTVLISINIIMFVFVLSTYISVIWNIKDKPINPILKKSFILIASLGVMLSSAFISLQFPLLIGLVLSTEATHLYLEAWIIYDFLLVIYAYLVGQGMHLVLQLIPFQKDATKRKRWYDDTGNQKISTLNNQ